MTDVDRIYEAALADEWEEQNKSERDNFPDWDKAIRKLRVAKATILATVSLVCSIADHVEGSTQEDRIRSIADDLATLSEEVAQQIERM